MDWKFYKKPKKNRIRSILEWLVTILAAVVVSLFIVSNIGSLTQIKEQSMEPTFKENDRVVIYKLGYLFDTPERGDIVILNKRIKQSGILVNMINEGQDIYDNIKYRFTGSIEKNNLIKRVIGVHGDIIDIQNGEVLVNGKLLDEKYSVGETYASSNFSYPIEVPEDKVYVLGDNRENSLDSRDLGFINLSQIKGEVFFRLFPIDRFGKLN